MFEFRIINLETPEQRTAGNVDVSVETESEPSRYDSRVAIDSSVVTPSDQCISSQTFENSLKTLPPIVTPNQPKHRKDFKTKLFERRERSFQASWFEKFPWLHYDEGFDGARCHVCYGQSKKCAIDSCRNQEDAFIRTGYSNWKNAIENFRKHETSLCHRTAISCDNALSETSGNIFELINESSK